VCWERSDERGRGSRQPEDGIKKGMGKAQRRPILVKGQSFGLRETYESLEVGVCEVVRRPRPHTSMDALLARFLGRADHCGKN